MISYAKLWKILSFFLIASIISFESSLSPFVSVASAQSESDDDIEALFNEEAERTERSREKKRNSESNSRKKKSEEIKELSGLVSLAPFDDVSVIQKRFLPKTGRFEFFGGGSTNLNDAFFFNVGVVGRAGYYITEKWGLEALFMYLGTQKRSVTNDLKDQKGVLTDSLVTPETYYGLDVKWSPIYGKYSLLDSKIVPFDLYFSVGLGITETNQKGISSPLTIHLGTGQIFAVNKSFALRWDFSWNFYTTKSAVTQQDELTDNLFITVGASFFFPEAKYR